MLRMHAYDWDQQARDRDQFKRRIDEATQDMANLDKELKKIYRQKQDSLYILTSIKLDEAIRGRISSEENTKKNYSTLLNLQIQGEGDLTCNLSAQYGLQSDLSRRPSMGRNIFISSNVANDFSLVILMVGSII